MGINNDAASDKNTLRALGAAFLLQAAASALSYALFDPLMVPGDIVASMSNIAGKAMQMRVSILLEVITALGIAVLGILLYSTLKRQNRRIALVALGLYLVEAALLAASKVEAFSLLRISQESVRLGHPAYLQALGNIYFEAQKFGNELHMLPFAVGATMFYFLFFKSGILPRPLALFGLAAAAISVIFSPVALLGLDIPLVVFAPNLPFELGVGIWLVVKGESAWSREGLTLAGNR